MPYNEVEVTVSVIMPDGSNPTQGQMTFFPSDFIWDTSTGNIVVVEPITLAAGPGLPPSPETVNFLAMDNPTLSTNWKWLLTAGIPGLPSPVPVRSLVVNYATAPTQTLVSLLAGSAIYAPAQVG